MVKNFKVKIGRKIILECVWLGKEKGKQIVGFGCFLSGSIKKFSYQNEKKKKLSGENEPA